MKTRLRIVRSGDVKPDEPRAWYEGQHQAHAATEAAEPPALGLEPCPPGATWAVVARAVILQCKTCPWKVGADPAAEIPHYKRGLHCRLVDTIRTGPESLIGPARVMACHYSKTGAETPCAGWMDNQLGPGNNIGLRLVVARGHFPPPIVEGPQHPTLEATIPKPVRRRGGRR